MSKISEIHGSNLFGKIIETGCSVPVAYKLGLVAGASKTILYTQQPYNKEYESELYGEFPRSVSKEFIKSVLDKEGERENINFVLASSWQLCDPKDPLHLTHGWFGLFDKQRNIKHYLHFTFNRNNSFSYKQLLKGEFKVETEEENNKLREFSIRLIGEIGVSILHTAIKGDINDLDLQFLTFNGNKSYGVLDEAYINEEVNIDLLVSCLEKSESDYLLVFDDNKPIRIEDLMRRSNQFLIQKGSFNPVHHGHVDLMTKSLERYPEAKTSFLISTYRYDKPHILLDELKVRIKNINKIGYPLILCKSVLYYETFNLLKEWTYNKRFFFPLGIDTLVRIYQTDVDYVNSNNEKNSAKSSLMGRMTLRGYVNNIIRANPLFKFLVFNRSGYNKIDELSTYDGITEYLERNDDGVSSTKIRNGQIENKIKLE